MPIKKTKPRAGSKPMTYFKGTTRELAAINQKKALVMAKRAGLRFYSESQATTEVKRFLEHTKTIAKNLENGKSVLTIIETKNGLIPIKMTKTRRGKLLFHQQPFTHGVSGYTFSSFEHLQKILKTGFLGRNPPNTIIKIERERQAFPTTARPPKEELAKGDRYSIELMAALGHGETRNMLIPGEHFVEKALPKEIVSVNITLDRLVPTKVTEQKKRFYIETIQKKFGVPIKFIRG